MIETLAAALLVLASPPALPPRSSPRTTDEPLARDLLGQRVAEIARRTRRRAGGGARR